MIARSFLLAALACLPLSAQAADDNGALAFWRQAQAQPQQQQSRWRANVPLPPNVRHLRAIIHRTAQVHGVSPRIVAAVIRVESNGNCRARNASGAAGAMQVLPRTARGLGVHGRLTDCATGIEAGTRYLSRIIHRHGTGCAALSLYERGEAARPRCTAYGRRVLAYAGTF